MSVCVIVLTRANTHTCRNTVAGVKLVVSLPEQVGVAMLYIRETECWLTLTVIITVHIFGKISLIVV